jgi:hypothetical protein
MIVNLSHDIFSCGTHVFVYALIHVMCLCVYVNMVCQRCMLYDDMYSHDSLVGPICGPSMLVTCVEHNETYKKWIPSYVHHVRITHQFMYGLYDKS